MKVYYPGPGHETYHPELGMLVPDKPFDLDAKTANRYIKSGLLKRCPENKKKKSAKTVRPANSESGEQISGITADGQILKPCISD